MDQSIVVYLEAFLFDFRKMMYSLVLFFFSLLMQQQQQGNKTKNKCTTLDQEQIYLVGPIECSNVLKLKKENKKLVWILARPPWKPTIDGISNLYIFYDAFYL